MAGHPDIGVERRGHVAILELRRPPSNYFDIGLLAGLADHYDALDADADCRAIVLAAEGKAFCAGRNHAREMAVDPAVQPPPAVANEAMRLFRNRKPVVAAIQGAAVGGGMGLALSADFRVVGPSARFWPNFGRLGFHAGFGLSYSLPRLVGEQAAALLLLTGRKVDGTEAMALGLADMLVPDEEVRDRSIALAGELAACSPLAVQSMRATLRRGAAEAIEIAMERELLEQGWQSQTEDYREGVAAMRERRDPLFHRR